MRRARRGIRRMRPCRAPSRCRPSAQRASRCTRSPSRRSCRRPRAPSSASAALAAASSRSASPAGCGRERLLEPRMALAAAAQVRVGGADHVAQPVGRVRGHHLDARRGRRPSPMNASSAPSKASAAIRSASTSSSTRKSGSMPALSACARRIRAQSPWIVEIHALSAARASSRLPSSRKRARTRLFISAAAFSVNVIARMRSTSTPSSVTARTKRSTSTVVLPVPAPARTSSEPSRRSTARSARRVSSLTPRSCIPTGTCSRHSRRSGRERAQLAGAHEPVRLADPLHRPVELLLELVGRRAGRSSTSGRRAPRRPWPTMPRGRGSSLPSGT